MGGDGAGVRGRRERERGTVCVSLYAWTAEEAGLLGARPMARDFDYIPPRLPLAAGNAG